MTRPTIKRTKDEPVTELVIEIPTHIYTSPKKKYALNLNAFNVIHYRTKHTIKQCVYKLLKEQLKTVKLIEPVNVEFQLIAGDRRRRDKSNFFSIASKIVYDALSTYGVVSDDNDEIFKTETLIPSGFDKGNQHIRFTFRSILSESNED